MRIMQTEALQHRLCSSAMHRYNGESLELLESGLNYLRRGPRVVAERTRDGTLDCMHCRADIDPALVLFPPSNCTCVSARTEINSTRGKKSRKYSS